jgi:uncharacterized integral membrane protein (TIGR00698 family)
LALVADARHDILAAPAPGWVGRTAPGVLVCAGVSVMAVALQAVETRLFGRAWLEALVLAILIGAVARSVWTPRARFEVGIAFSARTLLEVAVLLLGASVSAQTLMAIGPVMLVGVAGLVAAAIGASYGIGRGLGLPPRMAALVACGNAICGNSAIAAVAPVIGADGKDVASAIAFTAVLGVAAVLGLPLLGGALHMSVLQYGTFAGLTVYAVPQVLAAAAAMGPQAIQVGTLIKLVRVLMLGPVCCVAALIAARKGSAPGEQAARTLPPLRRLVPWFIVGFLGLATLRSFELIPSALLAPAAQAASVLTVVSMAALGLMTDLKVVARAGGPVTAAVSLSLLVLGGLGYAMIRLLGVG